jgi:hypothetical protein
MRGEPVWGWAGRLSMWSIIGVGDAGVITTMMMMIQKKKLLACYMLTSNIENIQMQCWYCFQLYITEHMVRVSSHILQQSMCVSSTMLINP